MKKEQEIYRILNCMEKKDIIDLYISTLTTTARRKQFIEDWNAGGE